jgi:hypothetical protein
LELTDPDALPQWLRAPHQPPWRAHRVQLDALSCALDVPEGWFEEEPPATEGDETSCLYRGASPVEWLAVRRLTTTGEQRGELANWVTGVLRSIGFPVIPPSHLLIELPELVAWREAPPAANAAATSALRVDEVHLYDGTAKCGPPDEGRFLHFYVVLARRDDRSWNLSLAFDSAALPGVPDELVASDDHARAAAVLAGLELT